MARLQLEGLVARTAQTPLSGVRVDTNALAAPGRALRDVGGAISAAGDVLGKRMAENDDLEVQRALSEFDYESGYIERREEALRTGTIEGFHDATAADFDGRVSDYVAGIENTRVARAVERRLLAARTGFLSDAAKAEQGVLTRESDTTRAIGIAEAVASFDYASRFLELAQGADTAGPDFAASIAEDYRQHVDEYVAGITDPQTQAAVRLQLLGRAGTYTSAAAGRQVEGARELATARSNEALGAVENRVRTDPAAWGTALEDGLRIIDALPGYTEGERTAMRTALRNDLGRARFEAQIAAATLPGEFDAIEAELAKPEWQRQIQPRDYDKLIDTLRVRRAGGSEALRSQATASIGSISERIDAGFPVGQEELRQAELDARAAGDAGLQWRVAELATRNDVYTSLGDAPLPVLREEALRRREALTRAGGGTGRLPPELAAAVREASAYGMSATYLSALAFFEFEGQMRPGAGETDFGTAELSGATSAVGPYQFTEGTWLGVVSRSPDYFPEAEGLDEAGILALRADPDVAARGAAMLANENRAALKRSLGRDPTEVELVSAHFLGAGGAAQLIAAIAADPTQIGADVFPTAAANNPGVFKFNDGTDRTVAQVMDRIAERSVGRAGRLGYVELEAIEKLIGRLEQGIGDDMMSTAAGLGVTAVANLLEEGFTPENLTRRGDRARYTASYYGIPQDSWTPLTEGEVQGLSERLQSPETTVDDKLGIAEALSALGPDMSHAAFRQLGVEDPVFAHAAGLVQATGDRATARMVLRGQQKLADAATAFEGAFTMEDLEIEFAGYAGVALSEIAGQRAVFEAAAAHYAGSRRPGSSFSSSDFRRSIEAVTGGEIDDVNGRDTVLPRGMEAGDVEDFFETMSYSDMVAISVERLPPRFADGTAVRPTDMEDVQLEPVGGGQYRVRIRGGELLTTGAAEGGQAQAYIITLPPDLIARRLDPDVRPVTEVPTTRPDVPEGVRVVNPGRAF